MFKPPSNINEIGWHPKYPYSPELYQDGEDIESQGARRWFRYYGHEYPDDKKTNKNAVI